MAKTEDQVERGGVPPRPLVPSSREREAGVQERKYVFEVPEDIERPSVGERIRKWAKDADPRGIKGPKYPLVTLALLFTVATWDDTAIAILGPEMRTEFGISLAFLASLKVMLDLVEKLVGPAVGYLSDRIKRVHLVRAGAVLANLSSLWLGFAPGIAHVVGSRMASGAGAAVFGPASYPMLADQYPGRSRARLFGFISMAGGLGGVIGPILAGNLADVFGWRGAVLVLASVASAVALMTFFLKEPKRGYWDRLEMGASPEEAVKEQPKLSWGEAWRSASSITTMRRIWYATPFLYVAGTFFNFFLAQYWAEVFQLSPSDRGYLQATSAVVGVVGIAVGTPIADRLLAFRPGRVLTLMMGLILIQASSFVILGFSPNLWVSIAFSLPASFVGGLVFPAGLTLLSMVVPARIRGLAIQTASPFQVAGIILYQILIILVAPQFGIRGAMIASAPLMAIGGLIYGSAALGVQRDIRAAKAASLAEQEMEKARESGRTKLLVCRDVDVTYEGTQVLFGVDFDVEEGEIVALLGTNGAGKSSLLRAISGIHEASNGAIFLDGRDITHVPPHENASKGVVLLPGGRAVFPTLTVEENLKAAAWLHREEEQYVAQGMQQVFDFFPVLRERLDQVAGNLSGGEQQMLALGQVFLMRPRLLMIDELSLGLAPAIVHRLLETLRAINSQGTTIVVVEQSINVALTMAKRAVFMEKGEIRFDGTTRELLSKPDLVRAVFLGIEATGGPRRTRRRVGAESEAGKLLSVDNVSVSFGGVKALDGVWTDLSAGEIVGFIGPNGAGKTTLFDVISGFVVPDEGVVRLEADDITQLSPDARARLGLGRSFQNATLFPAMTVRENIAVALERHLQAKSPFLAAVWAPQIRRAERRATRRVNELIALLNLRAYADKFVDELSTGTRRAVDIACVLASEPRVLLLDEPSSGLAQAETEELGPILTRLVRETGCGMLVIEHDMPLISSISDRMIAMELGSVIATGAPQEVLSDAKVLASYLSTSSEALSRTGEVDPQQMIEDLIATGEK